MNTKIKLMVTEIQRFCMHDGPGIRTTVFLKGCPLRCEWCHNPETQKTEPQILFYPQKCIFCRSCEKACARDAHLFGDSHAFNRQKCASCFECAANCPTGALEISGREMSIDEILSIVKKDEAFYGNDGGITLSGGEPFIYGENAVALLKKCKEQVTSTAVETCGYVDYGILHAARPFVDLFLFDVKDTDETRHKKYTGVSNKRILENLHLLGKTDAKIRLRCILVNGVNTEISHYEKIADIASDILNLDSVELIPYHAYGGAKATFLGCSDNGNSAWIPDSSQIELAKRTIESKGIKVFK